MSLARALPAFAAILLLVVACQQVPRPFQPDLKPQPDLLPGPRSALVVEPLRGDSDRINHDLTGLIAEQLRKLEFAATVDEDARDRYRLKGQLRKDVSGDGSWAVLVDWELVDPSGIRAARTTSVSLIEPKDWLAEDKTALAMVATDAAITVNQLVNGWIGSVDDPATRATVVVPPVDGAPGDGRASLTMAVRMSLSRRAVRLADDIAENTFVVLGEVSLTPIGGGSDRVDITWTVVHPDGRVAGTVSVGDEVPHGRLEGPWLSIAERAAEGSAEGLVDLLRRVGPASFWDKG